MAAPHRPRPGGAHAGTSTPPGRSRSSGAATGGAPKVGDMRLKLGRPDLRNYGRYFDAPGAGPEAPLTVTWAGVTTLLIDDGTSALMTDGFFSRPGLLEVGSRRLSPSAPRIDRCLTRLRGDRLQAVLPVHTHFDHGMDSAGGAARARAPLGLRNTR